MISQAEAANPNTVVYLETVGEVNLSAFQDTTPALVWSSYNGEEQGQAIADVLLGKVNPSGHLPFSWYQNDSQLPPITDYTIRPTDTTNGRTYQYFDGDVSYPFGYGQSYTTFKYSDITLAQSSVNANDTITVKAKIRNDGTVAGSEVPQLYVTTPFEPASAQRPIKRLEAFEKVTLNPGQSKTVTFKVKAASLAFFDEASNKYVLDPGRYGIQIGSSSANSDIKLTGSVKISGSIAQTPTVVNAKPIETGDTARGVAQRVMFDINTTIDPQLTVSMNDQQLYGYVTKGQSTPMPAGLKVSYKSDRSKVVQVTGTTLKAVGSGIATVTATVTYHGVSAATKFTVDVAPLQITSNPSTVFQAGQPGTFTVTTNSSPTATLTETGALPSGITFTDNGDGTATLAGTAPAKTGTYPITITAANGVSPKVQQVFLLHIGTLPTINSATSAQFVTGTSGSFTVTTTGFPPAALSESGDIAVRVVLHRQRRRHRDGLRHPRHRDAGKLPADDHSLERAEPGSDPDVDGDGAESGTDIHCCRARRHSEHDGDLRHLHLQPSAAQHRGSSGRARLHDRRGATGHHRRPTAATNSTTSRPVRTRSNSSTRTTPTRPSGTTPPAQALPTSPAPRL